jgi:aspartate aminotransferase
VKLSERIKLIAESPTLAVSAKAARMRAEGVDVIGFGAGEPDFATPEHIVAAAKQALDEGQTFYPKPASGLSVLKTAIVAKLARENNLDYAADQIVVTVGGKMACQLVFQAMLNPGDEVLIPIPYWVSYPEIVKLAGGVPVFIEGSEDNGFRVSPEQILAKTSDRTRALILNYPSNPAGHMYTPDQVRAIATALEGTDITVISDEIYDRLILDDSRYLSFAAAGSDAYARTVTLNSASKTFSMTGWRLGFIAGPHDLIKAAAKLQSQGTSGAAPFAQLGWAAALNGDQSCVDTMKAAFLERRNVMVDALRVMDDVTCYRPQGAFYTFPNVAGTYKRLGVANSAQFAEKLLDEAKVAVVPGSAFGMDSNVRLSFATGMDAIKEGLSRIAAFVAR